MKFPVYFEVYGGLNSVVRSRYFWVAAVVSCLMAGFFTKEEWWELAISVIPGLVGFSIAGVAIFVSLGSDSLRAVIAGRQVGESGPSPFISFMAMFTHFIVVQLIALVLALLAKAFYFVPPPPLADMAGLLNDVRGVFWMVGGLFFLYAVLLCVALAVEIFRLAEMIDDFQTVENEVASVQKELAKKNQGPGAVGVHRD